MEHIAEGATKTAIREMVPQHVVPAVEDIETIEINELEVQKPEPIGAIIKEHVSEKVGAFFFDIFFSLFLQLQLISFSLSLAYLAY